MKKEKAIMELMTNAKQIEVLESCITILCGWETTKDLIGPLRKRQNEIVEKNDRLYDMAAGGKFDIDKAF